MDQPQDPEHFRDRPEAYAAWAAEHHTWNPAWCAAHWAPCPVQGRNGVLASMLLMQAQIEQMPADVKAGGATAMNSWAQNQTVPACCVLGDEAMAELWGQC